MVAKEEALVAGVDHDGVIGQATLVEIIEHPGDVLVEGSDAAQVLLDVALISPGQLLVLRQTGRDQALEVCFVQVIHAHSRLDRGRRSAHVVVAQRGRLRDEAVVIEGLMPLGRLPGAVRRLVMNHRQERPIGVGGDDPLEREVGDEVGRVSGPHDLAAARL